MSDNTDKDQRIAEDLAIDEEIKRIKWERKHAPEDRIWGELDSLDNRGRGY